MKKLLITTAFFSIALLGWTQTQAPLTLKASSLDKSPMDIAYFPDNYPMRKTQEKITGPLVARVIYSRPQKDNRVIFGELVEYGKIWRLGANEATEIEFFKEVTIGGKKVAKGRYTLYAIPTPSEWTIIINKDTDTWGAFIYDAKKDLLRITAPVVSASQPQEAFVMSFTKTASGANLNMAWDAVSVSLPIGIK